MRVHCLMPWALAGGMALTGGGCVFGEGVSDEGGDPMETDGDTGDNGADTGDTESGVDTDGSAARLAELQGQWKLVEYAWEFYRYAYEDITYTHRGESTEDGGEYIVFEGATMTWHWDDNHCYDTWEVPNISIDADNVATDPDDRLTGYSENDEGFEKLGTEIALMGNELVVTRYKAKGTDADYEKWVDIYTFTPSNDPLPKDDWDQVPCEE